MKAIIYANGSSAIGIGHIMRTLTLSKELKKKGFFIEYITDKSDNETINLVEGNGFHIIKIENILNYLTLYQKQKYDLAIIDDYNIDEHDINKFYNISDKIVYIDDLVKFRKYNMDILINTSIESLNIEYKGYSKQLLGPKYAILRDEFKKIKYKIPKSNVQKVMITLGGGDEKNITKNILDSLLDNFNNIEYNIVLGNSYKYKNFMIENYKNKKVKFHVNTNNMVEIMLNSDLAISAGGNTLYELSACGIPSIVMIIAGNQKEFVQGIHNEIQIDYIDLLGQSFKDKRESLLSIFERNIKDYEHRKKISKLMFNLVDRNGTGKIVDEIIELF